MIINKIYYDLLSPYAAANIMALPMIVGLIEDSQCGVATFMVVPRIIGLR